MKKLNFIINQYQIIPHYPDEPNKLIFAGGIVDLIFKIKLESIMIIFINFFTNLMIANFRKYL